MQVPQITLVSNVVPVSGGVDVTLHHFVGTSWGILIPYTLIGVGLMTYGQIRLVHGERVLKAQKQPKKARKAFGGQRLASVPRLMKLARS